MQKRADSFTFKHTESGRVFNVKYNTVGVHDENIIDLSTVSGLTDLECNVDRTSLKLSFSSTTSMDNFIESFDNIDHFMYLTGGTKWFHACKGSIGDSCLGVRRIVGGSKSDSGLLSNEMVLHTVTTRYDEVFTDANIRLESSGASSQLGTEQDKQVCIGVNTASGGDCKGALAPLEIFSNKAVDVQCTDCFLGFFTDVFADIDIQGSKLNSIKSGFRNMTVNAALLVETVSKEGPWSASSDKMISFDKDQKTLNFWIGPIPFHVSFKVPVELKMDTTLNVAAKAQFGVTGSYEIGDLYLEWTPETNWTTIKPNPKFLLEPILNGDASFDGEMSFEFIPHLHLEIDGIFDYTALIHPTINARVKADTPSKQLCLDMDYDLDISHEGSFDLNVDWGVIHKNITRHFGPEDVYDSGDRHFEHICRPIIFSEEK